MHTKFTSPIKANNKGSCSKLTNYLEKENEKNFSSNKEYFFSIDRNNCNKWEVIQQIDNNAVSQKIEEHQDKFFSIVIAPSQQELAKIGNDSERLKEYTREVMENYASKFCDSKGENRGLESKDLVWYAKIENERKYDAKEKELVLNSEITGENSKTSGQQKEGDQRHVHIIISRCAGRENRQVLQEVNRLKNLEKTAHLCPTVDNRKVFNRDEFYRSNEEIFDKKFGYERDIKQSYDYCNSLKKGSLKEHEQALQRQSIIEQSPEKKLERTEENRHEQQQQMGMNI